METIEIDYGKIKNDILADLKAEQERAAAAAKAQKERDEAIAAEAYKKAREDAEAEFKAKEATWKGKAPAELKLVGKNSKSSGADEFVHWMRTGDNGGQKVLKWESTAQYPEAGKALQVGSDTEGGYAAPDDFYGMIVEQRDQIAWTRNVGIDFWSTANNKLQVPTESTKMSKFEITAEEGAYSDSDPIMGNVEIQIYKFTRTNKISEELLADEKADLMGWYTRSLARALALTESYYIAIGSGSSQPQGVTVGGTAGLTADTLALTAAEFGQLFYKLGNGYRRDAVWLMNEDVEGIARSIRDTSNWAFDPMGANLQIVGDWKYETFFGGRPIYTETGMATNAASAKVALIGNFQYYTVAEHTNLVVTRNPYLYEANGQVGFFARSRWGGAVTQAEAFQYATLAAS